MNIEKKAEYAKAHIDNIVQHDDAPVAEIELVVAEIISYAQSALQEAQTRRQAAEAEAL